MLIQKKDELNTAIAEIQTELEKVSAQADDAKAGLVAFQGEIEKLKREKHEMLAKKANEKNEKESWYELRKTKGVGDTEYNKLVPDAGDPTVFTV